MLSTEDYIRLSIHYNLFWIRIMKEHAVFIEATMPPRADSMPFEQGDLGRISIV